MQFCEHRFRKKPKSHPTYRVKARNFKGEKEGDNYKNWRKEHKVFYKC